MTEIRVTGLAIYPVKSMKGIELEEALLTPEGFEHDRRFMVVRANGQFVTQRDLPGLALIHTSLENGDVRLSRPGFGSISLPTDGTEGEIVHTKVWGDVCETVDLGEELSRWLRSALESDDDLRLVRMRPGFRRPQNRAELLGQDTTTFFADAAPFLVANNASLDALNEHLRAAGHQSVPMNRFRPNIVVSGISAFSEHALRAIGDDRLRLGFCHHCERCVVTTIDQDTAEKHAGRQPFKTLQAINPVPGKRPAPAFGHNAILLQGNGLFLRTGDKLTALDG